MDSTGMKIGESVLPEMGKDIIDDVCEWVNVYPVLGVIGVGARAIGGIGRLVPSVVDKINDTIGTIDHVSTCGGDGRSCIRARAKDWVVVPIAPGGQPIVLTVTLAEQSFNFLCSHSDDHPFDETLRPNLGNVIGTKRLRGLDGNVKRVDIVKTPVLIVEGYEFSPGDGEYGFIWDLTSVRQALEADIRGVLGGTSAWETHTGPLFVYPHERPSS